MGRGWCKIDFLKDLRGMVVLILLLSLPSELLAYCAPLQGVTASIEGGTVHYSVFDPSRSSTRAGFKSTTSPTDLTVGNGVVAWLGSTAVYYATYDPAVGVWVDAFTSTISPSSLVVADGVVAWLSSNAGYCATYDPGVGYSIGLWKSDFTSTLSPTGLIVADGVAAWCGDKSICCEIYDPASGFWRSASASGSAPTNLAITNATVSWVMSSQTYTRAYNPQTHLWVSLGVTQPLAYFDYNVISSSTPPVWVWFTDMSIGGTSWTWDFDDSGGGSSSQSLYHIYSSCQSFSVSQQVNGPGGTSSRSSWVTSCAGTATATPTFTSVPTSTATKTATPTFTRTPSATPTFTSSPTRTSTRTSTPIGTATSTSTPTPTFTGTSTMTSTRTSTCTPSATPTGTSTATGTSTPTLTFTATGTATGTKTPTATCTATATETATATVTPTPDNGWVQSTSNGRIFGLLLYGDKNTSAKDMGGIPAIAPPSTGQVLPHYASNSTWYTGVTVTNPNSSEANVDVTAYSGTGTFIETVNLTVPAHGKVAKLVSSLFSSAVAGTGWIRVTSDVPVVAFDLYGDKVNGGIGALPGSSPLSCVGG